MIPVAEREMPYAKAEEEVARTMQQTAPYPEALAQLVNGLQYKPGWTFFMSDIDRGQGSKGLTLKIYIVAPNTYHPEQEISVVHYMIVPSASYNEQSWRRWLFEQILLVEQHEAAEFFQIDGVRPFAPMHGPGNSPYLVVEYADEVQRRTSFRGDVHDS